MRKLKKLAPTHFKCGKVQMRFTSSEGGDAGFIFQVSQDDFWRELSGTRRTGADHWWSREYFHHSNRVRERKAGEPVQTNWRYQITNNIVDYTFAPTSVTTIVFRGQAAPCRGAPTER